MFFSEYQEIQGPNREEDRRELKGYLDWACLKDDNGRALPVPHRI